MATSRKITQTVTGAVTIFRGDNVKSSRDNTEFPAVNLVQSVSVDGEYLNVQSVELFPFSKRNVDFIDNVNIAAGGNTRMVGTIQLGLVKVTKAANGRTYTKWEVLSSDLTPSDQVPYAERKTEETPAETAAAPVAPAADLSDVAPF